MREDRRQHDAAERLFALGWLVRMPGSRSVRVTATGELELAERLDFRSG